MLDMLVRKSQGVHTHKGVHVGIHRLVVARAKWFALTLWAGGAVWLLPDGGFAARRVRAERARPTYRPSIPPAAVWAR